MKRLKSIYIVFILFVLVLPSTAQIRFFKGTLAEAQQKAREEKKLLFVDFYTTWCGPCKMMAREVFPLPELGGYFNQHYVACQLDAEKEVDKTILKKYGVNAFPCMVFMDAEGKELKKVVGVVAPGILLSEAKVAAGDEMPYEKLYAEYQKNKKKTDIAAGLLMKAPYFISSCGEYDQKKWAVRMETLFADYVKNKGLKNMVNVDDFYLISNFHVALDKDDPIFDFMLSHYEDYVKIAGRQEVASYLVNLNNSKIIRLCQAGNKAYKQELDLLEDSGLKQVYADMKFGQLSVRELVTYLADATFCLYRKDEKGFFANQDRYFAAMGDSLSVEDYTQPLFDMYTVNQGKLSADAQHKAIEWCAGALEKDMEMDMRVRLLMIMGECYKGIGERGKAKQALNQAFLETSRIENETQRVQMQQMVQQDLQGF